MQETNELSITPTLSPSYEVYTVYAGRVLCQICFTGYLKKKVKREKPDKISNIEHFKETALHWKNCSYEYKRVYALVDWKKREKMTHKAGKEHCFRKVFLFQKRKKLQRKHVFLMTLMKTLF